MCREGGAVQRGAGLGCRRLVAPEVFEAVGRQLRVSHRVLDVPVAEVVLNRPGVMPLVGELEAAGVAQHMRVDWKAELRLVAGSGDDLPDGGSVMAPRRSVVKT